MRDRAARERVADRLLCGEADPTHTIACTAVRDPLDTDLPGGHSGGDEWSGQHG